MYPPSFLQRFITGPSHVLAIDTTDGSAEFHLLEHRLTFITSLRTEYGLDPTCYRTVHCAHDADPLTYTSPLHDSGGTATAADLAILWREHLHQGLFVSTTGSHGSPGGRRALHVFANAPRLVSQIRITITPSTRAWGDTSFDDLAEDLRILDPLWDLPADMPDTDTARFHLAVQAPDEDMPDAREAVIDLLRTAGMSRVRLYSAFNDPRLISFQPTTSSNDDPSAALHDSDDPLRTCFGIHTTGTLFSATPTSDIHGLLAGITPMDLSWDSLRLTATRAGWVA